MDSRDSSVALDRNLLWRYAAPLGVVSLWGTLPLAHKIGTEHTNALAFATVRALISSILMWAFLVLRHGAQLRAELQSMKRSTAAYLGAVGALQTAVFFYTVALGARYVPSGIAAVLINTQPIFTVVLSALLFKQRPSRRVMFGILGAFAAMPLVTMKAFSGGGELIGYVILLSSALSWALATVIFRHRLANKMKPLVATSIQLWIGTALLLVSMLVTGGVGFEWRNGASAVAVLYSAVAGTCVPFVLWFILLERYSAAHVSAFVFLMPIVGVILGNIVLGERLLPTQAVGVLVVVACVLGIVAPASKPAPGR